MPSADQALIIGRDGNARCWWPGKDAEYTRYHDEEWGYPVHDDIHLFEKICLEGFQAGLSWLTILRKRDNFRGAFDGFDFIKIAKYTDKDIERWSKMPALFAIAEKLNRQLIMRGRHKK